MENFSSRTEERRRYPRIESNLPIQFRNLRKGTELPVGSLTSNISEGGVRFKSNEFFSLACRLIVEVTLPTAHKPVKAISKVAWIRKLPSSDQYELGNQFLEISKEDKTHINNFVNSVLKTNF